MSSLPYLQYPGVEYTSLYRKGGYHPINIGDIFHNHYRVVNKLSRYGGQATVWLVEDISLKRFAALKVLRADAYGVSSEIDVLRRLKAYQQKISDSPGSDGNADDGAEYVMKVFDEFEVEGPNGTHQCVVTEILGPSLASDIEELWENETFPFDFSKKLVAQIARGVAFLHKCGIVHADLHQGNILLCHPKLSNPSQDDIDCYFGKLRQAPFVRKDEAPISPEESVHHPQKLFSAPHEQPLLDLCLASSETVHVKICDFGEAFLYDIDENGKGTPLLNATREFGVPRIYAAPEIIFHEPAPGPPVDIWALATLMHMILTGGCPIFSSHYGIEKEVVREMVWGLGKLPQRWWTRWAERGEYFDENGAPLTKGRRSQKLVRLSLKEGMSGEYLRAFEDTVSRMLCYEIEDRILADEVVRLIELMDGM